jgi:hypothetical protein
LAVKRALLGRRRGIGQRTRKSRALAICASYHKHRKQRLQDMREDYLARRQERIARAAKWAKDNPKRVSERQRRARAANLELYRAREKRRRELHPEKFRRWDKNWRKRHPDRWAEHVRRGKAAKIGAAPPWLTRKHYREMAVFYREAQRLTKATGIQHHVDHIHPLRGRVSCGLHVPWNLQVLPARDNCSKNNKLILEATHDLHCGPKRDSGI